MQAFVNPVTCVQDSLVLLYLCCVNVVPDFGLSLDLWILTVSSALAKMRLRCGW